MILNCKYLRESCLCIRISGVEGVLLDWLRLSFRLERCTGKPDFSRQASSGGNTSLAGLLDIKRERNEDKCCSTKQQMAVLQVGEYEDITDFHEGQMSAHTSKYFHSIFNFESSMNNNTKD